MDLHDLASRKLREFAKALSPRLDTMITYWCRFVTLDASRSDAVLVVSRYVATILTCMSCTQFEPSSCRLDCLSSRLPILELSVESPSWLFSLSKLCFFISSEDLER